MRSFAIWRRKFLEVPDFRNVTLKCLSEVAVLNVSSDYDPKFVILFTMVMTSINRIIPPTTSESSLPSSTARSRGRIS